MYRLPYYGRALLCTQALTDLSGWKLRAMSCGATSTAVASEDSAITWVGAPPAL